MADIVFASEEGVQTLLRADATIREQASENAVVTSRPVEKGTDITDHVRVLSSSISLDLLITDTPINAPTGVGADSASAFITRPVPVNGTNVNVTGATGPVERVNKCYQQLKDWQRDRVPLRVAMSFQGYDNMIITRLDVVRTVQSGDSLLCVVDMQQINTVSSELATITRVEVPRARKRKEKGKQDTTVADARRQAQLLQARQSILSQAGDLF